MCIYYIRVLPILVEVVGPTNKSSWPTTSNFSENRGFGVPVERERESFEVFKHVLAVNNY